MTANNRKFGSITEPYRLNLYVQSQPIEYSGPPVGSLNVVDVDNNDVVTIDGDQVVAIEN